MEDVKKCQVCGKKLKRRANEKRVEFEKRKCCSHKCSGAMPNTGRVVLKKEFHEISYTKYGGMRLNAKKETLDEWNCQICGKEMPKGIPQFLYEVFPNEYIRVCGVCYCESKIFEGINSIRKMSRRIANYVTYELKPFYDERINFKSSFASLPTLD